MQLLNALVEKLEKETIAGFSRDRLNHSHLHDGGRAGLGVDVDDDYRRHALVSFVRARGVDAESGVDHLFTTSTVHVSEDMEDR